MRQTVRGREQKEIDLERQDRMSTGILHAGGGAGGQTLIRSALQKGNPGSRAEFGEVGKHLGVFI